MIRAGFPPRAVTPKVVFIDDLGFPALHLVDNAGDSNGPHRRGLVGQAGIDVKSRIGGDNNTNPAPPGKCSWHPEILSMVFVSLCHQAQEKDKAGGGPG